MKKIAIIGAGNMGSAIAASLRDTGYEIAITARTEATLDRVAPLCPEALLTTSNTLAASGADIVVLAVKPYVAPGVIDEIKGSLRPGAAIVSVVAAVGIAELSEMLEAAERGLAIFRAVPNTAIRMGRSATFISAAPGASGEALGEITDIFSRSGRVFVIPEKDMAACTALSSCGIAYFLRFIRAAVEGSVELGLRPAFATEVAAATAVSAAAVLEGGSHPEAEIDKVTTPGGITIRGLNALEQNGFTNAVIAALRASFVPKA